MRTSSILLFLPCDTWIYFINNKIYKSNISHPVYFIYNRLMCVCGCLMLKIQCSTFCFKIPFGHGPCVFPMRRSLSWVRSVYSLVWTEAVSTNERPGLVITDQSETRSLTSSSHFVSFTETTDHWPGWRGNGRKLTPINVLNGKMCSCGINVWKIKLPGIP